MEAFISPRPEGIYPRGEMPKNRLFFLEETGLPSIPRSKFSLKKLVFSRFQNQSTDQLYSYRPLNYLLHESERCKLEF